MCNLCAERPRVRVLRIGRGRGQLRIPGWANQQARTYLESRTYPDGPAAVQFGRQVVWTSTGPRGGDHTGAGEQTLRDVQMFEYFPSDRASYVNRFPFRRTRGRIIDAISSDDELWEALYQTYQLYNSDMRRLVFQQHRSPSHARAFMATLNDDLHRQIMGAMIQLTTTYIAAPSAPAAGTSAAAQHGAGVIRQIAQRIGAVFDRNPSLADAVMQARAGAQ